MSQNIQNLPGNADEVYNFTNGIQGQELTEVTFLQNEQFNSSIISQITFSVSSFKAMNISFKFGLDL